jgi:hypothetical protein
VAEESGKGIALVILGIVAIIAIVGLVLLFTGARKAAVGEFAVPAAKEYGGAIRGVYDPYARAFSGRSYEFPSGMNQLGTSLGNVPQKVASQQVTGEDRYIKGLDDQTQVSYNRQREEIPSWRACQILSYTTFGNSRFGTAAEASSEFASLGGSNTASDGLPYCLVLSELRAHDWRVLGNQLGLDRDHVVALKDKAGQALADGAYACCKNPGLTGLV